MKTNFERIKSAASYVADFFGNCKPEAGIILGSGLGDYAQELSDTKVLPYSRIPDFPVSTAPGHKGNMILGTVAGKQVIALQGRFHYYEGYDRFTMTMPVRVLKLLGIKSLIVSNAAGGVNPEFHRGDLMIIRDHINLLPNPLIGPNIDELGPRFPDMTRPYDPALIEKARKVASDNGIKLHEGVYLASSGPTYETPAEYHYYRMAGADAVGMSTTSEIITARHCDIPCFGISVITNVLRDLNDSKFENDEQDVIDMAKSAASRMSVLVSGLIASL